MFESKMCPISAKAKPEKSKKLKKFLSVLLSLASKKNLHVIAPAKRNPSHGKMGNNEPYWGLKYAASGIGRNLPKSIFHITGAKIETKTNEIVIKELKTLSDLKIILAANNNSNPRAMHCRISTLKALTIVPWL